MSRADGDDPFDVSERIEQGAGGRAEEPRVAVLTPGHIFDASFDRVTG